MTTNEPKCPVCDNRLNIHSDRCSCVKCDYDMPIAFFEAIQLQKAAAVQVAVQQERGRVVHWIINNPSPRADLFAKGWNGALDSIKNLIKQG